MQTIASIRVPVRASGVPSALPTVDTHAVGPARARQFRQAITRISFGGAPSAAEHYVRIARTLSAAHPNDAHAFHAQTLRASDIGQPAATRNPALQHLAGSLGTVPDAHFEPVLSAIETVVFAHKTPLDLSVRVGLLHRVVDNLWLVSRERLPRVSALIERALEHHALGMPTLQRLLLPKASTMHPNTLLGARMALRAVRIRAAAMPHIEPMIESITHSPIFQAPERRSERSAAIAEIYSAADTGEQHIRAGEN